MSTSLEIALLEKLIAIGGDELEAYRAEKAKFDACPHTNKQSYTEYCLTCGYNVWYGVDPSKFIKDDAK